VLASGTYPAASRACRCRCRCSAATLDAPASQHTYGLIARCVCARQRTFRSLLAPSLGASSSWAAKKPAAPMPSVTLRSTISMTTAYHSVSLCGFDWSRIVSTPSCTTSWLAGCAPLTNARHIPRPNKTPTQGKQAVLDVDTQAISDGGAVPARTHHSARSLGAPAAASPASPHHGYQHNHSQLTPDRHFGDELFIERDTNIQRTLVEYASRDAPLPRRAGAARGAGGASRCCFVLLYHARSRACGRWAGTHTPRDKQSHLRATSADRQPYTHPRTHHTQWEASEIVPGLWVGNYRDFANIAQLRRHNITHILSAAVGVHPLYPTVCAMVIDVGACLLSVCLALTTRPTDARVGVRASEYAHLGLSRPGPHQLSASRTPLHR